jgi:hypothetical protein
VDYGRAFILPVKDRRSRHGTGSSTPQSQRKLSLQTPPRGNPSHGDKSAMSYGGFSPAVSNVAWEDEGARGRAPSSLSTNMSHETSWESLPPFQYEQQQQRMKRTGLGKKHAHFCDDYNYGQHPTANQQRLTQQSIRELTQQSIFELTQQSACDSRSQYKELQAPGPINSTELWEVFKGSGAPQDLGHALRRGAYCPVEVHRVLVEAAPTHYED